MNIRLQIALYFSITITILTFILESKKYIGGSEEFVIGFISGVIAMIILSLERIDDDKKTIRKKNK